MQMFNEMDGIFMNEWLTMQETHLDLLHFVVVPYKMQVLRLAMKKYNIFADYGCNNNNNNNNNDSKCNKLMN